MDEKRFLESQIKNMSLINDKPTKTFAFDFSGLIFNQCSVGQLG